MSEVDRHMSNYDDLSWWRRLGVKAVDTLGRLYHGKEKWKRMNRAWQLRRDCTNVSRLGNVRVYENHRG